MGGFNENCAALLLNPTNVSRSRGTTSRCVACESSCFWLSSGSLGFVLTITVWLFVEKVGRSSSSVIDCIER